MLLAKSVASDLNDTITSKTIDGLVHSVFDHACNIQLDKNSLVILISPKLPNYPSAIKLDISEDQKLCSMGFKSGMKVEVNEEEIKIPDIPISILLTDAWVWDSSPLFLKPTVSEEMLYKDIEEIWKLILKYGKMDGIASLLNKDEKYNYYVNFIIDSLKKLFIGIRCYNYKMISETTNHLIGFGPGLTPSADDFLLGLMASIYYIGHYFGNQFENLKKITDAMISGLAGRTTLISEIMLKNGVRARFCEPLRELMVALINGTFVDEKFLALLNIGGTSGSDCAAGIVWGGLLMFDIGKLTEGEENVRKISH